ncbi:hypothetical protein FACS1894199_15270 [Bacteroidia bacterium]|nr:hypothetical protein FACS1894199_15270 [Bacteroidia bacterium]
MICLYSDTLGRAKELKKDDLKELDKALAESIFIKSAPPYKKREDKIVKFYYFKDKDKELYYNVAEKNVIRGSGKIDSERFLYSTTKNII